MEAILFDIDFKLSILFENMNYKDYYNFIYDNNVLMYYDFIVSREIKDINNILTFEQLTSLYNVIDNKLKEIKA